LCDGSTARFTRSSRLLRRVSMRATATAPAGRPHLASASVRANAIFSQGEIGVPQPNASVRAPWTCRENRYASSPAGGKWKRL